MGGGILKKCVKKEGCVKLMSIKRVCIVYVKTTRSSSSLKCESVYSKYKCV